MLLVVVLAGLAAGGLWYLTRPARLGPSVESALAAFTGAEVTVDRAVMRWPDRIVVTGLDLRLPEDTSALASPGAAPGVTRLFEADSASITLDLSALATGSAPLAALSIDRPVLHLTVDDARGLTNLDLLMRSRADETGEPLRWPDRLPDVRITEGEIVRRRAADGEAEVRAIVSVSGMLRVDEAAMPVYNAELTTAVLSTHDQAGPTPAAKPTRLTGRVDLRQGSASLQLERFTLAPIHRELLPEGLRAVWDHFDPSGALPGATVNVAWGMGVKGGDALGPVRVRADLRLDDVAFTIPLERAMRPRMTGVRGKVLVRGDRVIAEEVRGEVQGVGYRLDGSVKASNPSAGYDVSIATDPFTVPETLDPAIDLPRVLRQIHDRLAPSGTMRLEAHAKRDANTGKETYDGVVELIDARAVYADFPLPAESLVGDIRFSDREVVIDGLRGEMAGGGTVRARGTIGPPGDTAAVKLLVQLRDVPVGEALLGAMPEGQQQAIDLLMNQAALAELKQAGLIVEPGAEPSSPAGASRGGGGGGPPWRFAMGGTIDVDVDVDREEGPDKRYLNTTTIPVQGLSGVFEHFAVPVTGTAGHVSFNREAVRVEGVEAVTPTGAVVKVDGAITGHEGGGPLSPHLIITAEEGRIDELVLAALPEDQARQIRELQLEGSLAARARVFRDPEADRIAFEVNTELSDARADPFGSGYVLAALSGRVRVFPGGFDLVDVRGTCDDGRLSLDGAWRLSDPAEPEAETEGRASAGDGRTDVSVTLRGEDTPVDARLGRLLPDDAARSGEIAKWIEAYRPQGRVDFVARLDRPADGAFDFSLSLSPRRLEFDLGGARPAFREMGGDVRVNRRGVEIDRLAGTADDGRYVVDGMIDLVGRSGAAISFDADLERLGETARALMPGPVRGVVDQLELDGRVSTRSARLRLTPGKAADGQADATERDATPGDGSPAMRPAFLDDPKVSFEALLNLTEAQAEVGVPVTELAGTAALRVEQDAGPPRLDLQLQADTLRLLEREVRRLDFRLNNAQAPRRYDIVELRGEASGGVLLGRGAIDLAAARPGFRLRLDLLEAELDPLMRPTDFRATAGDGDASLVAPLELATRNVKRGVATASLTLDGELDDIASRRGRGAIAVRNATLFDAPLGLALLQSINLALPASRSFDRVECRWSLDGRTVLIDELSFETPSFEVTGAGTMALPSTSLDLQMVTRVKGRAGLGKLGEAFNLLKDEVIDIRVEGTLEDPTTRVASFAGFRHTWLRLFGLAREPRREPAPLPPTDAP